MANFRPAGSEKEAYDDFLDADEDDYSEEDDAPPGPPVGDVRSLAVNDFTIE